MAKVAMSSPKVPKTFMLSTRTFVLSVGALALVLGIACLVVFGISTLSNALELAKAGADKAEFIATWNRWRDAGMPTRESLGAFLTGRRRGLCEHTNGYTIDGILYQSVIAQTNLRGMTGAMIVTTNGSIILIRSDGRIRLLRK